jgi:20S proteasome alpha/beta subunit
MTICISGICDSSTTPTIIFCADRLVSAGIQFEGGSSKIIQVTINCVIMETSSDSATSEAVLDRFRKKIDQSKDHTILELAETLAHECADFRTESLDRQVVSKYNLVVDRLKADPNSLLRDAVNELRIHPYPIFEFIVSGLDNTGAHIYTVDQDGNVKSWDFLGFTTVGSGSELAFSEMTKWMYTDQQPLSLAIPRIYFAKKASERAQGVGKMTDFGFITLIHDVNTKKNSPQVFFISGNKETMTILENTHEAIKNQEANLIKQAQIEIDKILRPPVDQKPKDNGKKSETTH